MGWLSLTLSVRLTLLKTIKLVSKVAALFASSTAMHECCDNILKNKNFYTSLIKAGRKQFSQDWEGQPGDNSELFVKLASGTHGKQLRMLTESLKQRCKEYCLFRTTVNTSRHLSSTHHALGLGFHAVHGSSQCTYYQPPLQVRTRDPESVNNIPNKGNPAYKRTNR